MQSSIRRRFPKRQAFLFLIAILVPCVVLIVIGLRMIDQERQLEEQRRDDDRRQLLLEVKRRLLSLLEKPEKDSIVFTAPIEAGIWRLPWDDIPGQFGQSNFAQLIHQAETDELIGKRFTKAADGYRQAIDVAKHPAQKLYARLLLARVLKASAAHEQSQMEYQRVFASPTDVVDEHGIPLAFYAASGLAGSNRKPNEMRDWIHRTVDGSFLPPPALYLARDLATTIAAPELVNHLSLKIRESEQAEALQQDFGRFAALEEGQEAVWTSYGEPRWLVAVRNKVLIVVRANTVLSQVGVPASNNHTGEALGENFPGLRVQLPERPTTPSSRRGFIGVALIAALAFTLLAGYLLWRDVERDLHLAEMRSQFVSSVTHELRTPLTAIRMYTETLRLDEEVDRQTRNEYLDTILHESERLSRLVDNVLDFGKIERGKKIYQFKPVRLHEVVDGAARALQHPLDQAGFKLRMAVDRELPTVSADSDALQQAVLNLLGNAMKYSGDSRRIELGLSRQNGHAQIQVADYGIGIASDDQKKIFERFYRAPIAENLHIPGAGLGLPLVEYIAKAHGGSLEVHSTPGAGSTFTIRLPLEKESHV